MSATRFPGLKSIRYSVEALLMEDNRRRRAPDYNFSDYLAISVADAEAQWRSIRDRAPAGERQRQVDYVPVETLLCAAAMLAADERNQGSGVTRREPELVPALADLFRRRVASIGFKMANLDGALAHGGSHDERLWCHLSSNYRQLFELYRVVVAAARRVGIGADELPDFLSLEDTDGFYLLGQDELDSSIIEDLMREATREFRQDSATADRPSEREVISRSRIGQHQFAKDVLNNCSWQCVFCGFSLARADGATLLRASHIKPWRHSDGRERRDVRNGVAACPTHDAAFDSGLLTFDGDLQVRLSQRIKQAQNGAVRTCFDAPMLRERLVLGSRSRLPQMAYITWHHDRVFSD